MSGSKYQQPALLGFVGLLLIASPLLLRMPLNLSKFNLQGSEELEQFRLEKKKETSDKINELGIMPSFKNLKITNYLDTARRDPKPDVTGYLEDETVIVYDATGQCVGRIQKRKWLWKYKYKNTCELNGAT